MLSNSSSIAAIFIGLILKRFWGWMVGSLMRSLDSIIVFAVVIVSFSCAGDNGVSILMRVVGLGIGSVIGLDSIVVVVSISGVDDNGGSILMWVCGLVDSFIRLDSAVDVNVDVDVDVNVSSADEDGSILIFC